MVIEMKIQRKKKKIENNLNESNQKLVWNFYHPLLFYFKKTIIYYCDLTFLYDAINYIIC